MAPETDLLSELAKAESECEELIDEVGKYPWDSGPDVYPLGLGYAYPAHDIHFFHRRAKDADHLKTRIIAILERLGPQAEEWKHEIRKAEFHEVYIFEGLTPGAKRPLASGLNAAREVLRTARRLLHSTGSDTTIQARIAPTKRHGKPGPQPADHVRIKEIADSLGRWRDRLVELCDTLDDQGIPLSRQCVKKLKDRKVRKPNWADALESDEQAVIKSIERSRREAARAA
jgi:hypothetical protein